MLSLRGCSARAITAVPAQEAGGGRGGEGQAFLTAMPATCLARKGKQRLVPELPSTKACIGRQKFLEMNDSAVLGLHVSLLYELLH